jgi:glycosyltransferase involved in cell wall biosynthesis
MPVVSVGLPVYNGERYLREAIESVLAQTFEDLELVICDNASTDGTEAICREYEARDPRVRYQRNRENLGAARNFNLAFELARAPYFKWIAADDAIEPRFLERTLERLEAEPETVAVGTRYVVVNELEGSVDEPAYDHDFSAARPSERLRKFFDQPTGSEHPVWALMRTAVLGETELFRAFIGADFYIVASLLLRGPVRQVPEPLNRLRVHDETYSWRLRRENPGRDNMQGRAEASWWDPERRGGRLWMPQWNLVLRYARLFAAAPLPVAERALMLACLVYPHSRRSAVILAKELAFALRVGRLYLLARALYRASAGRRVPVRTP